MSLRPGAVGRKGQADDRMKKYKAGVDADEGRRRREEGLVEVRKSKRGDSLVKKRRELAPSAAVAPSSSTSSDGAVHALAANGRSVAHDACCQQHSAGMPSHVVHPKLEKISEMSQQLWSEDVSIQMDAITYFRKLLSIGISHCCLHISQIIYTYIRTVMCISFLQSTFYFDGDKSFFLCSIGQNPLVDIIIRAGIVPRVVQFLLRQDKPNLQFEAAWTLTNLSSGTSEHTQVVIEHGAVPILVQLLTSPSEEVREQAIWALGNVAGDSPSFRDVVFESGALHPLLSLLTPQSRLSTLRNATWALSNLFRDRPSRKFEQIKLALSVLQQLIYSNDDDILENACRTLSFLSNGTCDIIQAVMDANVCPRLVELLRHPTPSVLTPALRALGNIVTGGDDAQTQFVIDHGLLFCLRQFLTQYNPKFIKIEACWIISNITAGNKAQIQAVFDANIIPPLVHLLEYEEFIIKKEAAWAISNAISRGSFEQTHFLVTQGCIKPLCDLLTCPDLSILILCLRSLENILNAGDAVKDLGNTDGINLYVQEVEDCGGLDKIENLQGHDNFEIYDKAIKILEKYWEEEEEEGENLQRIGEGMDQGFIPGPEATTAVGFKFL